jgi:hypothetical protein
MLTIYNESILAAMLIFFATEPAPLTQSFLSSAATEKYSSNAHKNQLQQVTEKHSIKTWKTSTPSHIKIFWQQNKNHIQHTTLQPSVNKNHIQHTKLQPSVNKNH